jgi:ATP-dependent RNA helicase RhlE
MLRNPESIQLDRKPAPAVGITQAVYPVPQELKSALLVALLQRGEMQEALVFTRTKHRANRLADYLARHGIKAERIHGNRSQTQRTEALAGFKSGKYRVLVATDIAARGIDVEALGHVVNFDVPLASDDYIHRVGRTGRAEATGEAFTFVAPEEEGSIRDIERAIRKPLPRVVLPDFDYKQKPPDTGAPSQQAPPRRGRPAPRPGAAQSRRPAAAGSSDWSTRMHAHTGGRDSREGAEARDGRGPRRPGHFRKGAGAGSGGRGRFRSSGR